VEDNALNEAYHMFGGHFSHGLSLNPLSELVDRDKQVGESPLTPF
jgi:hypothetical protein